MFDKERELIAKAKSMSRKEALETMLTNPELLDPIVYLLFAIDAGVYKALPHDEYCLKMKEKAIKNNNKKLLKLVQEYK